MSTKVFYAYLFKENAEFGDLDKARAYLADLREFFIDMYYRYVLPYIKEGKFETANSLGTYRIYAR